MAATATCSFLPLSSWPIGFGFRPTEEELITHYLKNKNLGHESLVESINEIDLYKYDPEELPEKSFFKSDTFEWFFFRANTSNNKRTTDAGGWRSTGEPRPIKARGTNEVIATRQIFVFHRGRGAKAVKTNWVIHEYQLHPNTNIPSQPFVIFRLKENPEDGQNSTVASHQKKKVTQGGAILEMNREAQPNEQSVRQPPWNSIQQPASYSDDVGEVNMQPKQTGAGDSENENLTQILNSIFNWDGTLDDDATLKMCRSPWRSEPEPTLMDFQPSNVNEGEVEIDFDLYKHLVNSVYEDRNLDEMTPNNLSYSYNNDEWDNMVYELQRGFSSDTNTNTAFGLPYNHTIRRMQRTPLTERRLQYRVEEHELEGSCSVTVISDEGVARTSDISMDSDNSDPGLGTTKAQRPPKFGNVVSYGSEPQTGPLKGEIQPKGKDSINGRQSEAGNKATKSEISFWGSIGFSYILITKPIHHNSSHPPLVYVGKALLGIVMFVVLAQDVLLFRYRC